MQTSDGYARVFLQLLAVAGPVGFHAGVLQLHAEDDGVADRNHRPSGKLLSNVAWKAKVLFKAPREFMQWIWTVGYFS